MAQRNTLDRSLFLNMSDRLAFPMLEVVSFFIPSAVESLKMSTAPVSGSFSGTSVCWLVPRTFCSSQEQVNRMERATKEFEILLVTPDLALGRALGDALQSLGKNSAIQPADLFKREHLLASRVAIVDVDTARIRGRETGSWRTSVT